MAHPDVEELAAGLASEAEAKEARRLLGMTWVRWILPRSRRPHTTAAF